MNYSPPSAHGLFDALGHARKPYVTINDDGEIIILERRPRQAHDFEPTPPEPTRALCYAEMARIQAFDNIWECAAGDGRMARDLAECTGLNVLKSDLIDRGCGAKIENFYDVKTLPPNTCIITNPPFKECHNDPAWVRHALEVLKTPYLALLLPINWLSSVGKNKVWADHRPSIKYEMCWRIDFTGGGNNTSNHAWFVWDKAHTSPETFIRRLNPTDDPRQRVMV